MATVNFKPYSISNYNWTTTTYPNTTFMKPNSGNDTNAVYYVTEGNVSTDTGFKDSAGKDIFYDFVNSSDTVKMSIPYSLNAIRQLAANTLTYFKLANGEDVGKDLIFPDCFSASNTTYAVAIEGQSSGGSTVSVDLTSYSGRRVFNIVFVAAGGGGGGGQFLVGNASGGGGGGGGGSFHARGIMVSSAVIAKAGAAGAARTNGGTGGDAYILYYTGVATLEQVYLFGGRGGPAGRAGGNSQGGAGGPDGKYASTDAAKSYAGGRGGGSRSPGNSVTRNTLYGMKKVLTLDGNGDITNTTPSSFVSSGTISGAPCSVPTEIFSGGGGGASGNNIYGSGSGDAGRAGVWGDRVGWNGGEISDGYDYVTGFGGGGGYGGDILFNAYEDPGGMGSRGGITFCW